MIKWIATGVSILLFTWACYWFAFKPAASGNELSDDKIEAPTPTIFEEPVSTDSDSSAATKCPGEEESAVFSIAVEFDVYNTAMAERFRREGAPSSVRGWDKRQLRIRDDSHWQRTTGQLWGLGPEEDVKMAELMDEMSKKMAQADATTNYSVASKLMDEGLAIQAEMYALGPGAYAYDKIEVDTFERSFEYDNVKKYGQKHERPVETKAERRQAWMTFLTVGGAGDILSSNLSVGELGKRSFAGYSCTLFREDAWDTEFCVATIDGQEVVLYSKMGGAADSPMGVLGETTATATKVSVGVCVPKSLFAVPKDVEFAD